MKEIKILIVMCLLIIFSTLTSCGRNGNKEPYPNYPKVYPGTKHNIK